MSHSATPWTIAHEAPLVIFQTGILEWVAISSSKGSSWPRDRTHISCVSCIAGRFFFTTQTSGKPKIWCGPFLKSLLNLLQCCFCFMLWFFGHKACGLGTRDQSSIPCIEKQSLNHWTTRQVPSIIALDPDKDLPLDLILVWFLWTLFSTRPWLLDFCVHLCLVQA